MSASKKYITYTTPEPDDLVSVVREGVAFPYFTNLSTRLHFSFEEWSSYLHLSERTIQRYKKEEKTFDPIYSERIIQIELLYKRGADVFGNETLFNTWMDSTIIALGNIKPKQLLDTSFGISSLMDTLGRIEHGILA
jgi:putative toxin-antitoxin system antitoxin component (TIGR02293 family)